MPLLKIGSDKIGFGKDGKGAIIREDITITLGALAGKTGILTTNGGLQNGLQEDFRILKTELHGNEIGITALDEPVELYMLNGELTLAEAEAAIEIDGPQDRNDRVSMELAERWVRYIGKFPDVTGLASAREFVPVGKLTARWTFSDPEGWNYMAYNNSGANRTTGAVISLKATHYGVWVT